MGCSSGKDQKNSNNQQNQAQINTNADDNQNTVNQPAQANVVEIEEIDQSSQMKEEVCQVNDQQMLQEEVQKDTNDDLSQQTRAIVVEYLSKLLVPIIDNIDNWLYNDKDIPDEIIKDDMRSIMAAKDMNRWKSDFPCLMRMQSKDITPIKDVQLITQNKV